MSQIIRMFAGDDGETHFEDLDSLPMDATGAVTFGNQPAGRFADWHTQVERRLIITLAGECEITVSDGGKRLLTPGVVLLGEDTTGKGHQMKILDKADCSFMFVPVPQG